MRLTPRDVEKLMLHTACNLAQKRYARGLKLNYPESIALISGQILELIRDGHSLKEITSIATNILGIDDVMVGVPEMVEQVQVEGTLLDGTKLISVHRPICKKKVDSKLALYGSGLTKSEQKIEIDNSMNIVPGEKELLNEEIEFNKNRKTKKIKVHNSGSRSVQIGSHCCFEEVNKALIFDRLACVGYRLNIPAGTSVRFASGETKEIELVEIDGEKKIYGGNGFVNGAYENKECEIKDNMEKKGFIK